MRWFVHSCRKQLVGMPVGVQQTGMALLHMHSAFPTKRGKQMIVMSFIDVLNIMLMHR